MKSQTFYVVKFNLGYYAENQAKYDWSYTEDVYEAKRYLNMRDAVNRAQWGLELVAMPYRQKPALYSIEEVQVTTSISVI